jgi:8-oxo-dGTP pyrophosphatase MutT (NUDIX family)
MPLPHRLALAAMTAPSRSLPANRRSFDFRSAPILPVAEHLPPVPDAALLPDALRARFAHPPQWTPDIEIERPGVLGDREAVRAAVLVPLVRRSAGLTVLLTERTAHLSSHSGQIAFPGGRTDPTDADATATALREAWEEVGLPPSQVEVLGRMPTYTTGSGYVVTPVVGLVPPDLPLQPNPGEVAAVFEVPLAWLMQPANHRHHLWEDQGVHRRWVSMPYPDGPDERYIWGATAAMLRNFYRFLAA